MAASDLPQGTRLGAYRIVETLGRGGMGVVYRGLEESTAKVVAIKVVSSDAARDERFMARFRREARALRALAHPNIAGVIFVGEEEGRPFLVLELVPGGSLKDELARGPLTWREAARLGAQAARALGAVHGAGLVHRDLKPANILLDADRNVKLCDFGVVRRSDDGLAQSAVLTRTGELVGTLEYMAPEQADGGDARVDARTDLYALGATLHALLTGRPPFEGTGVALLKAHLTAKPRAPGSVVPGIPAALDDLVLRLLEKDPEDRPRSAVEVASELETLADAGRASSSKAVGLMGGAVVLAALVAAGFAVASSSSEAPEHVSNAAPGETLAPATRPLPSRSTGSRAESVRKSPSPSEIRPERRWSGRHGAKVMASAFSPDGKLLATGSADGTIKLWHAENLGADVEPLATLPGHEGVTWCIAFAPDGRRAISAGYDGKLKVWDVERARAGGGAACQIGKDALHEGRINALAVSRDGKQVVSGSDRGSLQLWELTRDGALELRKSIAANQGGAQCAAIVPDGTAVVTGGPDGKLLVTDLRSGERIRTIDPGRGWLVSLALSRDGKTALAGGWSPGVADAWGLVDGNRLVTFERHETPVRSVALSPDDTLALTGSLDGSLCVSETATGKQVCTIKAGAGVGTAAFSPDGRSVAAGTESAPNVVELWDLAGG